MTKPRSVSETLVPIIAAEKGEKRDGVSGIKKAEVERDSVHPGYL